MNPTLPDIPQSIALYLQRATESLLTAKLVLDNSYFLFGVINRLYYACFYAASALMISKGLSVNRHKSIMPLLSLHFVKPGVLDNKWLNLYSTLLRARSKGDYDVSWDFKRSDVETLYSESEAFIKEITRMLLPIIPPETLNAIKEAEELMREEESSEEDDGYFEDE
ncbi:MAG: HEPN domain-containing protein [Bacteroidales bacterium]|nr:HEPN domain-containing protein [Bacteroidales bacterium]